MKIEVNITKKYVFMFLFSVILIAGVAVVYAITPNPGHGADQVGPGQFKLVQGEQNIWAFPGAVSLFNAKPELEINDVDGKPKGSLWRLILNNEILSLDMSNDRSWIAGHFITPLSFNSMNGKTTLGFPAGEGVLEVNHGNLPTASFRFTNNAPQKSSIQLDLSPANAQDPVDLAIDGDQLQFTGYIAGKKLYTLEGVCLGYEQDCRSTWDVQLRNMPLGSWCGWTQGATKDFCGGLDPFIQCPSGQGYTFSKRTILNWDQQGNSISVSTCVRTA